MRNLKTLAGKSILALTLLTILFTSCNKDDVSPDVDPTSDTIKTFELTKEDVIKSQAILDSGFKKLQEELKVDEEFMDLVTIAMDFSILPMGFEL